ncbi:MAG: hypothetical protein HY769_06050 [Candidatus Stahlbacteria bacterium]|nr:hypothetical protein [Candidatus Stahlbacteria bacterium]
MHPLYETARIPEKGKSSAGGGVSYVDYSGECFKGIRADGFIEYAPAKWLVPYHRADMELG